MLFCDEFVFVLRVLLSFLSVVDATQNLHIEFLVTLLFTILLIMKYSFPINVFTKNLTLVRLPSFTLFFIRIVLLNKQMYIYINKQTASIEKIPSVWINQFTASNYWRFFLWKRKDTYQCTCFQNLSLIYCLHRYIYSDYVTRTFLNSD